MNITLPSYYVRISELDWPVGSPSGLPKEFVLPIPYFFLFDGEEDKLDDFIIKTIFDMTGVMPSSSFAFEPVCQ